MIHNLFESTNEDNHFKNLSYLGEYMIYRLEKR